MMFASAKLKCQGNSLHNDGVNSLAPVKFQGNFRHAIFKQILVIDAWGISCEIAQLWMSLNFTDDQSTLVQVMAWCRQATSHYLSQCWPRSLSSYGVTRPQWVNYLLIWICYVIGESLTTSFKHSHSIYRLMNCENSSKLYISDKRTWFFKV